MTIVSLAVTVQAACGAARAEPAPIRDWWVATPDRMLGERLSLGSADGLLGGSAPGWRFEPDPWAGADQILCHLPGAPVLHSLPDSQAADFDARALAQPTPGAHETFGLAFWWQAPGGYYLARADSRNNNVRLYHRDDHGWGLLASRDVGVPVGQWHELNVRTRGTRVVVGLNQEPLLQVFLTQPGAGSMAFWADERTGVCFQRPWLLSGSGQETDQPEAPR